jgi:acetyl esterase/lipase
VIVAGDSSGGGLAMSLLLTLKRDGLPLPAGMVLFCPGIDLGGTVATRRSEEPQPAVAREIGERVAAAYLAGHPLDDPIVSPLLAELGGLPPMLIQAATGDQYCAEAQALAARAVEHGVDARLELYPVATHVFQIFWTFLPEATEALESAGRFAREVRAPETIPAWDAS